MESKLPFWAKRYLERLGIEQEPPTLEFLEAFSPIDVLRELGVNVFDKEKSLKG